MEQLRRAATGVPRGGQRGVTQFDHQRRRIGASIDKPDMICTLYCLWFYHFDLP